MKNVTFLNPELFWLFLLLPVAFYIWYINRKKQHATVKLSTTKGIRNSKSILIKLLPVSIVLRLLALSTLIVALARPQIISVDHQIHSTHGIDIIMAMDISGSMLARDLQPNRLEALKTVAADFVKQRVSDRIGIVIYAAEAYTKTPATSDKPLILNALRTITYSNEIEDGTAIGVGLGTAINRVKDSPAKSKVIILLTDGVNNTGAIDPILAAKIAKEYNIKVYTIGIGTNGLADSPVGMKPNGEVVYEKVQVEIDEELMKEIAQMTGGQYFRATDTDSLKNIYEEINQLEKTKIDEQKFVNTDEKFHLFALISFILLSIEIILRKTLFRGFI
ncbi:MULTISPECIES: vWA domain-containing protein [Myroides]|uniref:VWA domain-containing protein n=1 Tax=Myroides albus TaxID=2562892 RepID=A0A6I3LJA7_9FLAO|nr:MULTISPECIES: VWA domain-containing protein [Myroides]MTG97927.1 VWA domain-containing protein [Myroides albus]MVX36392.1 VWA domain-containing protein [Myroides sp. LoEW2-1]UVD81115.1 VWA domain-containing protein [Myroides albus]